MVILVTRDLMFGSRVKGAAESHGIPLKIRPQLPEPGAIDADVRLVILDLQASSEALAAWHSGLAEHHPQLQTLAYGPHVMVDALRSARAAGLDQVLARGQFDQQLESLFAELA